MIKGSIEEIIFETIDQFKVLFYPEQWNSSFLEYSKNELFAMLFVYRRGSANMTEIADYLNVPLNTATGIISRLEKRGMIKRERDIADKRVVTIAIGEEGKQFLAAQMKEMERLYHRFMETVSEEEKVMLFRLVGKLLDLITSDPARKEQTGEIKKNVRKIIIE